MENQNTEAHELILKAREALRRGDKETAHALGEQAALLAPDMEAAWLILTATDPNPEDALAYAQQALEIDPSSERALKAVEWAIAQLRQAKAASPTAVSPTAASVPPAPVPVTVQAPIEQEKSRVEEKSSNRAWIYAAALFGLFICIVVLFTVYTGVTQPAFISLLKDKPVPTQENLWAPMKLEKPAGMPVGAPQAADTPIGGPTLAAATTVPTNSPTSAPTEAATSTPTSNPTPSEVPTEAAIATPQFAETPGAMSMQIIEDTPTSEYAAPASAAPLPAIATDGTGARWIDVDLTNQRVYAYEGDAVINSFLVSTGTWLTPTVTGQYKVYVKYRSAPMSGPGYYLPNVPYIMYFYKGYGLHGTYWHNNFGTPMSHGCVNLRTDEAAWLYDWASVGTLVNVHY